MGNFRLQTLGPLTRTKWAGPKDWGGEIRHTVRSNLFRLTLAFLFVAVTGYFFDLECLINRCEASTSVAVSEHGECISPALVPDTIMAPTVVAEFFSFVPVPFVMATVAERTAPPPPQTTGADLRPPPLCTSSEAISRRGPPVLG